MLNNKKAKSSDQKESVLVKMKWMALTMNADNEMPKNDLINQNCLRYFESFEFIPVLIPNALSDITGYFDKIKFEAIVLSGGCDVNEDIIDSFKKCRKKIGICRDWTEHKIMDYAIRKKIPILGICRGMQFINVYFGGSIVKNISTVLPKTISHIGNNHKVRITEAEFIKKIRAEEFVVNSFHEHGITENTLAPDLQFFAVSTTDQVIEGLFHPKLPIIGIQWHPERPGSTSDCDLNLINAHFSNEKFRSV